MHSFNADLATKYGILEAILIQNFEFWIKKNEANERGYREGRYWTFNSTRAFSELFPYASPKKIRYALQHLIDAGIIMTGNFNNSPYDRTLWYAFTDFYLSICQKRQMEIPEKENRKVENVTPIPDINTDINPDYNKKENNKKKKEGKKTEKKFIKPTIEEVKTYVLNSNLNVDPEYFYDYYEANGWRVGKDTMKDWQAAVRNWHRRNLNNPRQQASTRAVAQINADDQPYEPEPTEDIRPWREFFDEWQEILGMRPAQTVGNVRAAKQLKAENDDEMLTALMVALAMRSQTRYLTREIKNITTPLDLLNNRERVWSFYQEHRETWKWQQSMRRGAGLIN